MKFLGILAASSLPLLANEEAPLPKLPELWHTITPTPKVIEALYLQKTLPQKKHAIFRDLGKMTMTQSPYHGHPSLDSSATVWSSDLQVYEFFQQSQIALETLDFHF